VQAPVAEHVSALVGSHAVQAAPLIPHVTNADVLHVEPEQQPDAQSVELHPLHVPEAVQVCGLGHDWHAPPPLPHALVVLPVWQVLLASQHPVGQEIELQAQLPPEQTWPAAQGPPIPHMHTPADEHVSAVVPQSTHAAPSGPHALTDGDVHVVPEQQPPGHEPRLQTHAPPEQT